MSGADAAATAEPEAAPHPFRLPAFRLLFIGRTLSTLSESLVPAALSIAVVLATGSAGALAGVLACALVPRVALMPLGGILADRLQARRVAICADLTRFGTQAFVGIELIGGDPSLWRIGLAQFVSGAASACAIPTLSPLVVGTVPAASRQVANAAIGFTKGAAWVLGPMLAGTLIFLVGAGWVFIVDAVAFAVSALLLAVIKVRHVPATPKSLRADLVEGWSEVKSRDWFWMSLIAHAVWNFASGTMMTLGPVLAVRHLGGEETWVWVLQAGGVGLVIGSLLASRARFRRPVVVANLGLAIYALPLVLFAVNAPLPLLIVGYGLGQIALGFFNPTWQTAVQRVVPEDRLARVDSYDWLVSLSAQPVGYMLAPLLAGVWSPAMPLLTAAGLVLVCCVGAAVVRPVRQLVLDPVPAGAVEPAGPAASAPSTAP